jgi:hypothetical protein
MAKDDPKGGVTVGEAETGGGEATVAEGKATAKPNAAQKPEAQTGDGEATKPSAPGETGTTPGTNWR